MAVLEGERGILIAAFLARRERRFRCALSGRWWPFSQPLTLLTITSSSRASVARSRHPPAPSNDVSGTRNYTANGLDNKVQLFVGLSLGSVSSFGFVAGLPIMARASSE